MSTGHVRYHSRIPGVDRLHAARFLLSTRQTRASRAGARREALRLYMILLPDLVLDIIFKCISNFGTVLNEDLLACSLVCRKWSALAPIALHDHPVVRSASQISLLRRTLTSSDVLARRVRTFTVILTLNPLVSGPNSEYLVLADCLENLPNLSALRFELARPGNINNAILERLQSLHQLKEFTLIQHNYPPVPTRPSRFDPMLLRFLPSTVAKFHLRLPYMDMLRAVPDIFQRVYPSRPAATPPPPHGGLKLLDIETGLEGAENAINFPALTDATSIPTTLTTLKLKFLSDDTSHHNLAFLYPFLKSCTQLEELDLTVSLPPPLASMPPPKQLRALKISLIIPASRRTWRMFSQDITTFVTRLPRLTDFSLEGNINQCSQHDLDLSIEKLLDAFGAEGHCRLRNFTFGSFNEPELDRIEILGPAEILINSRFGIPSIETFEHLCMRATLLNDLNIAVPLDYLPRVVRAVETLKHLQSVKLHNYYFKIDPAAPLRTLKRYKHFTKCCKILQRHLKSLQQPEHLHPAAQGQPAAQE